MFAFLPLTEEPSLERLFSENAARVGSTVDLDDGPVAERLALRIGDRRALASAEAAARIPMGDQWSSVDETGPYHAIADVPVAITVAVAGVVETGSVVLVEQSRHQVLVDLWAQELFVLLDRTALVSSLHDITEMIVDASTHGMVTVLSGPSRTADIERRLTIGVQGPRAVTVVLMP